MTDYCYCRHSHWPLLALPLVVATLAPGCGATDEIQSYTVPKEAAAPQAESTRPAEAAKPTDRMLGAILPVGDRTWFFKVAGPSADMDRQADSITEFWGSISVKPGAAKPDWKLPEGWREEAGTGMRAATIMVPAEGKPLELTVIPLDSSGSPDEILSNINRWRGQMSLPEVDQKRLAETTRETNVGDATMTIVDLRGTYSGGMVAPFAGRGPFSGGAQRPPGAPPGGQPSAGSSPSTDEQLPNLPPGHPPIDLPPGHPPIDTDQKADDGN